MPNEPLADVQRWRSYNPLAPLALLANLRSSTQDDPDGMDELANEAGPDRPTSPPLWRKTLPAGLTTPAGRTDGSGQKPA